MAPRREILDSEDEGSDFSPVKDTIGEGLVQIDGDALDQPRVEAHDAAATNASSLKSTDPSFFRRIYEEQRAVAAGKSNECPAPAPEADMSVVGSSSQIKNFSSLTSITDPSTANQKTKKKDSAAGKDVIDLTLTQVTTPRKEAVSGEVDPWDVPSSPLPAIEGSRAVSKTKSASKVAKTYGKRKRASQQSTSSQAGPDPYDFPSTADPSPARTTKKTKRGMQSPLPTLSEDSSPVMLVPQTEDGGSGRRASRRKRESPRSLGSSSVVPDTGLYIAPSALTASQKQQYQLIAMSSDPGQDTLEPALPVLEVGEQQLQKSSMATTIAYSTPSRFASSGMGSLPSTAGPELPSVPVAEHEPSSSPDVISEEARKSKRGRQQEPPLETRSARKKRATRYQSSQLDGTEDGGCVDATMDLDAAQATRGQELMGLPIEDDVPQPEDSLNQGYDEHRPGSAGQTNAAAAAADQDPDYNVAPLKEEKPEAPTPAPKKKRGRKKKEPVIEDDVDVSLLEENQVPVSDVLLAEDSEPPAKKKRGRPRKSTLPPEPDTPATKLVDDSSIETPPPPTSTAKTGRRGRKKEEAVKSAEYVVEEEEKVEDEPAPALAEISQNSRPSSARDRVINASDDDDDDYDGGTKENDSATKVVVAPPKRESVEEKKEVKKATTAPAVASQASATKVQYRVGLSRKSRIAPLLKIMRK